jgi:hypothetical protein
MEGLLREIGKEAVHAVRCGSGRDLEEQHAWLILKMKIAMLA